MINDFMCLLKLVREKVSEYLSEFKKIEVKGVKKVQVYVWVCVLV